MDCGSSDNINLSVRERANAGWPGGSWGGGELRNKDDAGLPVACRAAAPGTAIGAEARGGSTLVARGAGGGMARAAHGYTVGSAWPAQPWLVVPAPSSVCSAGLDCVDNSAGRLRLEGKPCS